MVNFVQFSNILEQDINECSVWQFSTQPGADLELFFFLAGGSPHGGFLLNLFWHSLLLSIAGRSQFLLSGGGGAIQKTCLLVTNLLVGQIILLGVFGWGGHDPRIRP